MVFIFTAPRFLPPSKCMVIIRRSVCKGNPRKRQSPPAVDFLSDRKLGLIILDVAQSVIHPLCYGYERKAFDQLPLT